MIKTCEFVSPKHPDKICDRIADGLLDAYLNLDPNARVAIEVMGGHGKINISGEVTALTAVNAPDIARGFCDGDLELNVNIVKQSPFIAQGVDAGGAGDQGIMVGFACRDTDSLMPYEYELSRSLCREIFKHYPYDGKVQVTVDGREALAVAASFQNAPTRDLLDLVRSSVKAREYFINQAGEWSLGGFEADSGLSGRKIVVDAYGPNVPVGGGSFSGKDATKVDRSGAYMARKIAVTLLKRRKEADQAAVRLAYAIGRPEPVMAYAELTGQKSFRAIPDLAREFDLTPKGISRALDLKAVRFAETSDWGHFGRDFPWDKAE